MCIRDRYMIAWWLNFQVEHLLWWHLFKTRYSSGGVLDWTCGALVLDDETTVYCQQCYRNFIYRNEHLYQTSTFEVNYKKIISVDSLRMSEIFKMSQLSHFVSWALEKLGGEVPLKCVHIYKPMKLVTNSCTRPWPYRGHLSSRQV